jgi:hypothetical protein
MHKLRRLSDVINTACLACHGHSGNVFSGGLDGDLGAYSAINGEIVCDVDTKGDY